MKVKFTKLAALLLSGAALLAAGCTDYEVDIQKNADAIASANDQIKALQSTIATLETAAQHQADVDKLNKAISDLETALNGKIADLTTEVGKKLDKTEFETAKKQLTDALDALSQRVKALEDADFQAQINALSDKVDKCATKEELQKAVTDLTTYVDGEIAKLKETVDANAKAIKKINEETIPAINEEIKAIKEKNKAQDETLTLLSDAVKELVALTAGFPEDTTIKEYVDNMEASLKQYVQDELKKYVTLDEFNKVKAQLEGRLDGLDKMLKGFGAEEGSVKTYIDGEILKVNDAIKALKEAHAKDIEALNKAIEQVKADILAVKASIRSLVFVPEVYVDGVEAILIQTLKYPTQTIEEEVYNTAEEVAVESEDSLLVSPKVIAKYHVIPSNADISFLDTAKVTFVVRPNDPFKTIRTRAEASEDFKVTGKFVGRDAKENDVLCFEVEVEGTAATDEFISVVALQLTQGDETYTSDYACIYSEELDDLRIAMPANEDYHYRRALEEVAGIAELDAEAGIADLPVYIDTVNVESCDTSLIYNVPMDLKTITEAHIVPEGSEDCETIDPAKLGLDWKFELVDIEDWTVGAIDQITLDEEAKTVTATIDAMDLTPVVRTYLFNEDEENAQIAYIKFYVAPQDFENVQEMGAFEFSCKGDSLEVVTNVYEKFGMSKETFLRVYPEFSVEADATKKVGTDTVIFNAATGEIKWKADAPWLWDNAVDEDDAPGEALTKTVYFTNPHNGAKFTVTLKAMPAVIQAYKIPVDKYIPNYWNDDLTAAQYNVFTPDYGETDSTKCVFHNNINAAFLTDDEGVIDLTGIGQEGLEVSNIKYFFCDDMAVNAEGKEIVTKVGQYDVIFSIEDGEGTRKDVNDVEFDVTGTNTILLAKLADDKEAEPVEIAYICNDAKEKDFTPNVVVLVKDPDPNHLAKKLLNTNEFSVLIGATGMICGDEGFEVNLWWQHNPGTDEDWLDHFQADYIQPVKVTDTASDNFIDAVDFGQQGSFITLKDLVAPKDWRGRIFGMNEGDQYYNYWKYYGIFKISVDKKAITCDLTPDKKVPVTVQIDTLSKESLKASLNVDEPMRDAEGNVMKGADGKDLTIGAYIDSIDDGGYGFLTYRNNGTYVKAFKLFVPVTVQYGWGIITTDEPITVNVETTIKEE